MRMNTGKKLFLCAGLLAFFLSVSAQSYSLRTNVIGLATTNLNLEASMTLNRKWSPTDHHRRRKRRTDTQ